MVIDLKNISGLPIQLKETTCDEQRVWKLIGDIVPKPGKRTLDDIRPMLLDDSISKPKILYYMYRDVKCAENVKLIERWGLRYDISIFFPYKLGKEYMKTSGHYHPYVCSLRSPTTSSYGSLRSPNPPSCPPPKTSERASLRLSEANRGGKPHSAYGDNRLIGFPEVYEVIHGEALFLLQKPNNVWGDKGEVQIEDAIALIVKQGQKAIMPPNYGHIAINRSTTEPLVTSNWVAAAFSSTYWSIERHKGGAYYFLEDEEPKSNDCYTTGNHWLPPLRWFKVKNLPQFSLTREKPMYEAFLENPHHFMFLRYPQRFAEALQPDNLFVPCTSPCEEVKSMPLLNLPTPVPSREGRLPKEIEKSKFPEFLDEAKEKFPKGELLVQYVEDDNKIIILGIGNSGSCAHQTTQALKKEPSLKQRGNLKLKTLRLPETGYLLR